MGDERLNSTGGKADGATSAALFIALLLLASGAALNLSSAPSALEARSFFFAKTYFTSTLLLSIFNFSMPLYHLVSHFLLFVNPSLFVMRLFSVVFGAASVFCLSSAISLIKNKTNSLTSVHAAFVAPAAGAIACFSGRAVEQSLGFCLILASFLFLSKALLNNDSSKRSLFIAASVAAAYSFNIGAVIVTVQTLLFRKYIRATETISDGSVLSFRRDTSLILKCMIPALFIWLIGCFRAAAGATHAPGTFSYPATSVSGLLKAASGWNHLLTPTAAFSILILIFLTGIFRSACGGKHSGKGITATAFIVVSFICLAFPIQAALREKEGAEDFKRVSQLALSHNNYPVVFLWSGRGNEYFLYRYAEPGMKRPVLIYPDPASENETFRLGGGTDSFVSSAPGTGGLAGLEEFFLRGNTFRIIGGTCDERTRALDWIKTVAFRQPSGRVAAGAFCSEIYRLKNTRIPDELLEDLLKEKGYKREKPIGRKDSGRSRGGR